MGDDSKHNKFVYILYHYTCYSGHGSTYHYHYSQEKFNISPYVNRILYINDTQEMNVHEWIAFVAGMSRECHRYNMCYIVILLVVRDSCRVINYSGRHEGLAILVL